MFGVIFAVGVLIGTIIAGSGQPEPQVIEKVKYVDIQTYKTWGTTNLVPIGTRKIPTPQEWDRTFGTDDY